MTDVLSEEKLARLIVSWAFAECQPGNGDVFGWIDENASKLAAFLNERLSATSSRPSGAEAMREAAAKLADKFQDADRTRAEGYRRRGREDQEAIFASGASVANEIATAIRALPIAPQEVREKKP